MLKANRKLLEALRADNGLLTGEVKFENTGTAVFSKVSGPITSMDEEEDDLSLRFNSASIDEDDDDQLSLDVEMEEDEKGEDSDDED